MINKNILNVNEFLAEITGADNVILNAPMKNHTSFKAGGNADVLVTPKNVEQLINIIKCLTKNNSPFFVMGNGTNLLVTDNGFRGVIIKIRENIASVSVSDNVIFACAGALLSNISKIAYENGLEGMEFAEGIPGTLGGAVAMNAGAYGREMKDVISKVNACDINGNLLTFNNADMNFVYRSSLLQSKSLICTSTEITLKHGIRSHIKSKMDEYKLKRTEKQPLDKPSAGSTFKRPEGNFAGKLIMDSGLKGYKVGGAYVSEKHCGFVVTDGKASASDIINLIKHIQKNVNEKFNIMLDPEVKIIGE